MSSVSTRPVLAEQHERHVDAEEGDDEERDRAFEALVRTRETDLTVAGADQRGHGIREREDQDRYREQQRIAAAREDEDHGDGNGEVDFAECLAIDAIHHLTEFPPERRHHFHREQQ